MWLLLGIAAAQSRPGPEAVSMLSSAQVASLARDYNFPSSAALLQVLRSDRDLHVSMQSLKLAYRCASLVPKAQARRRGLLESSSQELELGHSHDEEHQQHRQHQHAHQHAHQHGGHHLLDPLPAQALERPQRRLLQPGVVNVITDPKPRGASGVPLLHSRPKAARKIYLDFDGHWCDARLPCGSLPPLARLLADSNQARAGPRALAN